MIRDHLHLGFPITDGPIGHRVDAALLAALLGAAFDRCNGCQHELTVETAEHAPTTTRLCQLACVVIQRHPPTWPVTPPFQTLARLGIGQQPDEPAIWEAAAAMTIAERLEVVETALTIVLAELTAGARQ